MKNISVRLQQFVKESLHPNAIVRQSMTDGEFEKWNDFIKNSIGELSRNAFKSAINTNERKINVFELINLVTDLSNTINEYLTKYAKVWQKNPMATRVRQCYLSTCGSLEDLLDILAKRFPKIATETAYSNYSIFRVKQELRVLAVAASQHLQGQAVDLTTTSLFSDGLNFLINQRNLKRGDDHYIRKLVEVMVKKQFTESTQVIDFLIANDFNLPDFFLFCLEQWNAILTEQDGLIEQKQKLLDLKSHLYDLSISFGLKSPWDKHRLYDELNNFLSEKYTLVKERLKISRQLLEAERYRPNAKRVLINLSVAQLGLFLRMQVEKGILAKEHIGELFAFYARHFYTPNTDFISPESLQKKSSVVEHATARKLKALLISMLNWLNTNYNLSNYN